MEHEYLRTELEQEMAQHTEVPATDELQEKEPEKTSFLYDIYSLLHDLVYILAGITLAFVFCIRLVGVNGESMLPTLYDKDYLALEDLKKGTLSPHGCVHMCMHTKKRECVFV